MIIFIFLLFTTVFGADTCGLNGETSDAPVGPYYQKDNIHDTTTGWCTSTLPAEELTELTVYGTITDVDTCEPISYVTMDVWHADSEGNYDDKNNLETNNCRTRFETDEHGYFEFTTLLPHYYPIGTDKYRPKHIHYQFQHSDYNTLKTQQYWEGDQYLMPNDGCLSCNSDEPSLITPKWETAPGKETSEFKVQLVAKVSHDEPEVEEESCEECVVNFEECEGAGCTCLDICTTCLAGCVGDDSAYGLPVGTTVDECEPKCDEWMAAELAEACASMEDKPDCLSVTGCKWNNNKSKCKVDTSQPTWYSNCEEYTKKKDCESDENDLDCTWDKNASPKVCISTPPPPSMCSDLTKKKDCTSEEDEFNCDWDSTTKLCSDHVFTCSDLNGQMDACKQRSGCKWKNSKSKCKDQN